MVIKAVDPIADIGAAREVKLLQTQAARRASQRPGPPESPQNNVFPQPTAAETEQAKAEQQKAAEAESPSASQAQPQNPSLRFHVDQDTGRTIAELVDHTGQVLRQVPTEEALEIAKAIGKYQGMFVDLKV